jgi:FG-GAP-like repeat
MSIRLNQLKPLLLIVPILILVFLTLRKSHHSQSWIRHTIDDSSLGADGIKVGDSNRDGLPDIVTSWEQGGTVRLYFNPGPQKAKQHWAYVDVGKVGSPEDALLFDFDGDGAMDVISACEGNERSIFFHHAPRDPSRYLKAEFWNTLPLTAAEKRAEWMFCNAAQVDGQQGPDIIAGSKNENAEIGWFESPKDPGDPGSWRWHTISSAGWVMSLLSRDMDGDDDLDILVSDRKGRMAGVFWLENPGPGKVLTGVWQKHLIGADRKEVMFLGDTDLDGDGMIDVVAAVRTKQLIFFRRKNSNGLSWQAFSIETPKEAGDTKAVAAGDINLDGKQDLVFTCEHARNKSGVMWLENINALGDSQWRAHDISGSEGMKYDLVELMDLDGDGDLDALTTEENNLGVVWYENPVK